MKPKTKVFFAVCLTLLIFANVAFAAFGPLVTCGPAKNPDISAECTLSDLFLGAIRIVNFLIGSATLLAIGYVLYGGVKMIYSRGNEKGVGEAKTTITNAITGLVIVMLAYLIVDFALSFLTGGHFSFTTINQILNLKGK